MDPVEITTGERVHLLMFIYGSMDSLNRPLDNGLIPFGIGIAFGTEQ